MRFASEHLLDQRAHFRNARGTPDQHHLVDLLWLEIGVFQSLLARTNCPVNDRLDQLLILLARDLTPVAFPSGQFDIEFHRRL